MTKTTKRGATKSAPRSASPIDTTPTSPNAMGTPSSVCRRERLLLGGFRRPGEGTRDSLHSGLVAFPPSSSCGVPHTPTRNGGWTKSSNDVRRLAFKSSSSCTAKWKQLTCNSEHTKHCASIPLPGGDAGLWKHQDHAASRPQRPRECRRHDLLLGPSREIHRCRPTRWHSSAVSTCALGAGIITSTLYLTPIPKALLTRSGRARFQQQPDYGL